MIGTPETFSFTYAGHGRAAVHNRLLLLAVVKLSQTCWHRGFLSDFDGAEHRFIESDE